MPSLKYSYNSEDLKKIAKGALFAGGGAVGAYLLTEVLPVFDFKQFMWLAPLLAVALNAAVKFFSGKSSPLSSSSLDSLPPQ